MDPLPTAVFFKRMNSLFASAFNPTLSLFDFRVLNFVCLELDSSYGKKFGFYSYFYWGLTRLRSQHFDICLEDKSRVGTPIRRYLVATFQITHFFGLDFEPLMKKVGYHWLYLIIKNLLSNAVTQMFHSIFKVGSSQVKQSRRGPLHAR